MPAVLLSIPEVYGIYASDTCRDSESEPYSGSFKWESESGGSIYRAVIDFEINEVILSSDVAHDLGDMRDFTFLINRIEGVLAIESDFEYASLVGKKRRGPKPEPQIEKRYDNTVDGYCIPMP